MNAWQNLTERVNELDAIGSAAALLEWDQQTYMPQGAASWRGTQAATLGRIAHERFTAPEVGGWLDDLEATELDPTQKPAVWQLRRRYRRATALPVRLVEELARARNEGYNAWIKAKEADDFTGFAGPLQRLIDLSRESAALLGAGVAHPYDALLEDYDPGSTVAQLRPMFSRLATELATFLSALDGRPHPKGVVPHVDSEGLRRLSDRVIADMGYDLTRGRLDLAEHPFTTGLGLGDTRITTHLHPENLLATLGGTIHECGHGLYEQGLPDHWQGTGLNRAAGMGLHESQSRFWENFIGRSLPYCRYLIPRMQGIWPGLTLTPEQLFAAANRVERSLIRIFADEATYNLHIIVRFEIEVALLEGKLEAIDLPDAWDDGYRRIVGVTASNRRQGILQDVHWSSGYLGYFPSYTIGNLYAASLGAAITEDLPDLWFQVERGDFSDILAWLRAKVHHAGSTADAPDIMKAAVGERDPVEDMMAHLWARQGRLYGVERPGMT